jgi:hypothetical protein
VQQHLQELPLQNQLTALVVSGFPTGKESRLSSISLFCFFVLTSFVGSSASLCVGPVKSDEVRNACSGTCIEAPH